MCTTLYKYFLLCDATFQSLDNFRIDKWSSSDFILLSGIVLFLASTMGLVLDNREKVYEAKYLYADDLSRAPGLGGAICCVACVLGFLVKVTLLEDNLDESKLFVHVNSERSDYMLS